MRHNQFPALSWIKKRANDPSGQFSWPNCILTVKTTSAERPNIKGPLSIFSVESGHSVCETNGRLRKVEKGSFFLSNEQESYSLYIDAKQGAETTNIHFREGLPLEVWNSCASSINSQLGSDYPHLESPVLFSKLYRRSDRLDSLLLRLKSLDSSSSLYQMQEEEICGLIVEELFRAQLEPLRRAQALTAMRRSTRLELLARLYLALDYIQSNLSSEISLDELAAISLMSKFHFIRCFKAAFKLSPYQYIKQLRLAKAAEVLKANGTQSISHLAFSLGFQNLSSFSRAFQQQHKLSPRAYQLLA